MRHRPIESGLFASHRENLKRLLPPNALAVVNSNDILPTNADGTLPLRPQSDLFYLTGVEQEETLLLLYPDALEEKYREVLFVRRVDDLARTWEGAKLTKDSARTVSAAARVEWLPEFDGIFRRLMCECGEVYLNSNEHRRAGLLVETREARFVRETQRQYPLHQYRRLAPLMSQLRAVKSGAEIDLIQRACDITDAGFRRACRFVRPGVNEMEIEAEFAHEFIRRRADFAYSPIIASGANACALHYSQNDQPCRDGDVLLLDVAASYANYNADLTRSIPVNGRFTRRQRQVYDAVLRTLRAMISAAKPGKLPRDWQKEAEAFMEKELVDLGLLKVSQIRRQDKDNPVVKQYFMHGIGHPLGLDVHDVAPATAPIQSGWFLTVEPGIYIPKENLGIRLENDILVRADANVDLMASVPLEAGEIEDLMRRGKRTA